MSQYITVPEISILLKIDGTRLGKSIHRMPIESYTMVKGRIKWNAVFFYSIAELSQEEKERLPWWPWSREDKLARRDGAAESERIQKQIEKSIAWRPNQEQFLSGILLLIMQPNNMTLSIEAMLSTPIEGMLDGYMHPLMQVCNEIDAGFGLNTIITPQLWETLRLKVRYPYHNSPVCLRIVDELLDQFRSTDSIIYMRRDPHFDAPGVALGMFEFYRLVNQLHLGQLELMLSHSSQENENLIQGFTPETLHNATHAANTALREIESRADSIKTEIISFYLLARKRFNMPQSFLKILNDSLQLAYPNIIRVLGNLL